nr:hypothetical protein [Tanacetum cinerariifolium]
PCRALTVRKSVRPLPSYRLALRYTSHHLDHFTFGSSSSHSSLDHSSLRHSITGHSLSGHTPQNTTDADSSTPPRFVHPSLSRTPQCSEAYLQVNEFYFTGEVEDEVESSDRGTMEVGVDVVVGIDIPDGMLMPDVVEHLEQRTLRREYRESEARSLTAGGERASLLDQVASWKRNNARLRDTMMMKRARVDRFRRRVRFIESELRQICRFRYYDMMRFRRLETFAARRLALVDYEATRAANALKVESQSQNVSDGDCGNGGNGHGGDGNGGNGNVGNGNCESLGMDLSQPVKDDS